MLKKILIEIDSKITSEFLYHYALKYAKITKAELWLGLFHKKGKPFQKAESILKKLFLEAEKLNIEVQGFIKEGDRLKELKNIINKEKIDLAFLSMENLNKLLKLPCSIVTSKIINIGKIYPKRILFILKGPITHLKEKNSIY
ncbi:MAG: hypothetical protein RMI74_00195 [Thermodesulfobacterium sp.]|nr:hypothetical protein [Thermodesulfobacterium sp.]